MDLFIRELKMIKKSICKVCGKEFEYEAIGGRLKRYCSDECKKTGASKLASQRWRKKHPVPYVKPQKIKYICKECGIAYERYASDDVRGMFCSRACHLRWESKQPRYKAVSSIPLKWVYQCICPECGKHFETELENKVYCSSKCSYEAGLREHREENIKNFVPKIRACKECGKMFETKLREQNRQFCCKKCASKYWNRIAKSNKITAIRGAKILDKDISLKKLAERDKDICYLCGKPVDWNDKRITEEGYVIAGANYPSIEHVLPICRGGTHSWNNVRLAHRYCNCSKNYRTIEEVQQSCRRGLL